jgi:hypothetical protein
MVHGFANPKNEETASDRAVKLEIYFAVLALKWTD